MKTVLLTGATGFLGSHIAESLIVNDIQVVGLKRKNSNIWRCYEFKDKIHWIDVDEKRLYKNQLLKFSFSIIIHGAWIGVESNERNNWDEQAKNINFLLDILDVAKEIGVTKFIFLGSQAEYGNVNGKITEKHPTNAVNAYGGTKLACLEILKSFCKVNQIDWIWLRLFSIFGEKQGEDWLIPSLIKSMKKEKQKDFTLGDQKYAYLYVKDLAKIITDIIKKPIEPGIYNISSNVVRTINSLAKDIRDLIDPDFILNFGALEYRKNQSMHIEGDVKKIFSQIGDFKFTDFNKSLVKTIIFYKEK